LTEKNNKIELKKLRLIFLKNKEKIIQLEQKENLLQSKIKGCFD